jgi:hypothetical protein
VEAHPLGSEGIASKKPLARIEAEVDNQAAALWGTNATELADIQRSLADLR